MAPPPLLTLDSIALTFGGQPLFEEVSLSVHPGDRIGLVGRNGSGKSTLMKIMAGLAEADDGTRFLPPGKSVAYMDQDPDFAPFQTLLDFVKSGLPDDEQHRADAAMETIGLNGATPTQAASGGERRRAALARVLASAADVLLLDEPTNHLDIRMIDTLEGMLAQSRAALVIISHDRAFLRNLTSAMLWVDRGRVRRLDRGFAAFEDWRDKTYEEEDAERHKLGRLIKAESRWAVEGISGRRKRNMGRVRRLQEMRAERSAQIARVGAAALDLGGGQTSGKLVVEAESLTKAWDGRPVVQDFSIKIQRGDRVALIGPNGAGKTTLLNLLTGKLAPDAGQVKLGTNLEMAVFDQTRASLDPDMSLWDTLTGARDIAVSGRSDQVMVRGRPRHVVGYLKDFLFSEAQARSPVRALSGGERARLLLARLLARPSNFLVLDEPTNDLDVETLDLLQEQLADVDGTVLLVSHDRDFLDRIATLSVVMPGNGRAEIYAGGYTDMLAQGGQAFLPLPAARKRKPRATRPPAPKPPPSGLTGAEVRRLAALPDEMARLEHEIARLEAFLSDPDLFTTAPAKFEKASAGLVERQAQLAQAEEAWLDLEARREAAEG